MITGQVDALRRAIVMVTVRNPASGRHASWEALVDTGFLGELLAPHSMIHALGFDPKDAFDVEADLADGSIVTTRTYIAFLDWFGQEVPIELMTTDGTMPLLGVGVLRDHDLHINFPARTVVIS